MPDRFENFTTTIASIYRSVQRIKSTEMTEFGLKGTHVMCLYSLLQSGDGMTAAELSVACGEDKAAISRSIRELTVKGFVEVFNNNGKKYKSNIRLTQSGQLLAEKITRIINNAVIKGGKGLTDHERSTFYYALNLIADNLSALSEEKC